MNSHIPMRVILFTAGCTVLCNNALFNFMKEKTSGMWACAILLPNFRYRTMNLHKSTLIIIFMHVNMFDVSYDIVCHISQVIK